MLKLSKRDSMSSFKKGKTLLNKKETNEKDSNLSGSPKNKKKETRYKRRQLRKEFHYIVQSRSNKSQR